MDFKFFRRTPDIGMSLTEYFDDTVSRVVRKNNYDKIVNKRDIHEMFTTPEGVAELLLAGGAGAVAVSRHNEDDIASAFLPGQGTVRQVSPMVESMSFAEGVLMACDATRRAFNIQVGQVYYTEDNREKIKEIALEFRSSQQQPKGQMPQGRPPGCSA